MEDNSNGMERVRGGMVFSGKMALGESGKGKRRGGNKWGSELKFKGGHGSQDAFP